MTDPQEVKSLLTQKMELHNDVLLAMIRNDVGEYLEVFSEKVPKIIEIEQELFRIESAGFDVKAVSNTIEAQSVNTSGSSLDLIEKDLRNALKAAGYVNLDPDTKDIKRIDDMIKKGNAVADAARMQKATKYHDKIFRRGKQLIEVGRDDLAKGFWMPLIKEYKVTSGSSWGAAAPSSESLQMKVPSDFTDKEKVEFFDAFLGQGNFYVRSVLENGIKISRAKTEMFSKIVTLMGPAISKVIFEMPES